MNEREDLLWLSRVEDYLVWQPFPATRRQVIDRVTALGLPPSDVYGALLTLPEKVYHSPKEVVLAMRPVPHYGDLVDKLAPGEVPHL